MIKFIRYSICLVVILLTAGAVTHLKAQAIELGTEYTDSFCVATPKIIDPDTLNFQSERDSCIAMLEQIALENALEAWRDSVAEIISEHINKQNCLAAALTERFTASHPTTEHHYTLYYYDQAGNLVQTIPPAGVMPVPTGAFSNGIWNGTEPLHEPDHITRYQYNTLGQVVSQRTPDAGESDFYYDRVQRLRFSQNAKQLPEDKYAYTKYDGQSRIIEVGEVTDSDLTDEEINDPLSPASGTQDEVYTIYDEADETPPIPSDNTRGRVAKVSNDNMTSYYDYDSHGNVRELTHDIPALGINSVDDPIISMQYEYDLVSGNVNEFRYEPGELDQFTQRFTYDADNRITSSFSSDDGYVFEEDARYFYYLHGPLARVELGEDKVQGLDYFYTLQGWIKGVNMPGSKAEFGLGQDGDTINPLHVHRFFGTDTMMYSLGYNYADYTPIGGTGLLSDQVTSAFQGLDGNLLGPTNMKGLFNGNISLMLTHNSLATQAMAYQYDALHRITFATSYDWNPGWGASNDYSNPQIIYDPNGNIQRQDILSVAGNELLTYDYYDELGFPNRLKSVSGGGSVTGLGTGDYIYDNIGNLVTDNSEGASMTWDVYGKLRTVIDDGPTIYSYDAMGNRLIKERPPTSKDVYVRDASGNVIALYNRTGNGPQYNAYISERYMYGSSRLGVDRTSVKLASSEFFIPGTIQYKSIRKLRSYELSNHLGNVLTNLSDRKLGVDLNSDKRANYYGAHVLSYADYYPFGLEMPLRTFDPGPGQADLRHGFNGKEKDGWGDSPTQYDYGFRIYNPAIGRFLSVDPLSNLRENLSPYNFVQNNPLNRIDPTGALDDWVMGSDKKIRWDKNANSQATTMAGELYLGKTLNFKFNSYIDKQLWDGPNPWFAPSPAGDKLTSTISITGIENSSGELIGISEFKDVLLGKTPLGKPRGYYPGLGDDQNKYSIDQSKDNNGVLSAFDLNFEQHASVSPLEEFGLGSMNYHIVNVAQRLTLNYSEGELKVNSYTDIFPSATLTVNGIQLMYYPQPSFKSTHKQRILGYTAPNPYRESIPRPIYDTSYKPAEWYGRKMKQSRS